MRVMGISSSKDTHTPRAADEPAVTLSQYVELPEWTGCQVRDDER
jgi:hypothetical protein